MLDEKELCAFLSEKASERWALDRQPYLLSSVAPDLRARGEDYQSVLGDEKLKAFARRVGQASGFRLVEHPTQRPKVGIVPAEEQFEFSHAALQKIETPGEVDRHNPSVREQVLVDFLRALGHLPDSALDEVTIPIKTLVRLLVRR